MAARRVWAAEEDGEVWVHLGLERINVTRLQAEVEQLREKVRELHRALANGYGVEDGGLWEDRAVAAEAEVDRLNEGIAALLGEQPTTDDEGVTRMVPWRDRLRVLLNARALQRHDNAS